MDYVILIGILTIQIILAVNIRALVKAIDEWEDLYVWTIQNLSNIEKQLADKVKKGSK